MIVGIVGTHHAPMRQLVRGLDAWAANHASEDVVIQAGPLVNDVRHARALSFTDEPTMLGLVERARIVVTHGGPSLLLMLVDQGRVPVVMPRDKRRHEHVDDHQVDFAEFLRARDLILLVRSEKDLGNILDSYDQQIAGLQPVPLQSANPEAAAGHIDRLLIGAR